MSSRRLLVLSLLVSCTFLLAVSASAGPPKPTPSSSKGASKKASSTGVVLKKSAHDVRTTADRLVQVLQKKGMTVFTRIDHAQGAKKAGMTLRPTELVVFGNPKVGTPLMKCQQLVALDLPQKALIYQDADGDVYLAYNDPQHLAQRHDVKGCEAVLNKVAGALHKFSTAATSK